MPQKSQKPVYVLNGPNLNKLGTRNPAVYGTRTLAEIEAGLRERGKQLGVLVDFRQSNQEGDLIDWCQEAEEKAAGLIINAGGYTHTSVALADALEALTIPVYEVHLSNIHAREEFRHTSLISRHARAVIVGFGEDGYHFALEDFAKKLT